MGRTAALWFCAALFASGCSGRPRGPVEIREVGPHVTAPEAVVLPAARRFGDASAAAVELTNSGDTDYVVESIRVPAGVRVAAGPRRVRSGRREQVRLTVDTNVARTVAGPMVVRTATPGASDITVTVHGEVGPYIATALEPHPELDRYFTERMRTHGLVGLGAAAVRGQDIIYLGGFGFEDREAGIPVDPQATVFRWGSLSKGVTATAAFLASLDGQLSLDDPVSRWVDVPLPQKYLPRGCEGVSCAQTIPLGRAITLRHLLTHTAGIQDYGNGTLDPVPPVAVRNDRAQNGGFIWALSYWSNAPLLSLPGDRFRYSSFGFNLAGAAIDRAVHGYEGFVARRIAEPLEMSSFGPDSIWEPRPRRVAGYVRSGGTITRDADDDVSYKLPAGGFASTPADLGRWCAGLLGDVVVPRAARDGELWHRQPGTRRYGLGFYTNGRRISHSGGQQNTRTALMAYPERDVCFVVMTNSTWINPYNLVLGMSRAFAGSE